MVKFDTQHWLPDQATISGLLSRSAGNLLPQLLREALVGPAIELVARPSKCLRAQLVGLGARTAHGENVDAHAIAACSAAVELLHAGSLIVDDVQDGSPVRRGSPSIHIQYGVPRALCTGNWLYFWPLRILKTAGLPEDIAQTACMMYQDAVEKAHYGQALDLAVRADELAQSDVVVVARAALELKTGMITSLAMSLGATITGAPARVTGAVANFGRKFGVALQILDDFGNLIGRVDPEKRGEDLRQRKLSGVWLQVASRSSAEEYEEFKLAVRWLGDGDRRPVDRFVQKHCLIEAAVAETRADLEAAFDELTGELELARDAAVIEEMRSLAKGLIHAYF